MVMGRGVGDAGLTVAFQQSRPRLLLHRESQLRFELLFQSATFASIVGAVAMFRPDLHHPAELEDQFRAFQRLQTPLPRLAPDKLQPEPRRRDHMFWSVAAYSVHPFKKLLAWPRKHNLAYCRGSIASKTTTGISNIRDLACATRFNKASMDSSLKLFWESPVRLTHFAFTLQLLQDPNRLLLDTEPSDLCSLGSENCFK